MKEMSAVGGSSGMSMSESNASLSPPKIESGSESTWSFSRLKSFSALTAHLVLCERYNRIYRWTRRWLGTGEPPPRYLSSLLTRSTSIRIRVPDIEVGWHCFAKAMHETIVNSIPFS